LQGHLARLHHRLHGPHQGCPGREQPRDPPVPALPLHRHRLLDLHVLDVALPARVRLHWREAGDPPSPAVVWIHGGSVEDSSFMLPDLEPFLPRIRALFPDTRGHGLSQKFERPEDYTYPEKGRDLLLWLDGLGIGAAVWGGASMGGALSLWAAAHHPERVL